MSAVVYSVECGSLAEKHGITAGCTIERINGEEVFDILEYRFLSCERSVTLDVLTPDGERKKITVRNDYENLGIEFENPLIDKARSCRNKCIFCFIDQLPGGMRETLYFKDDDSRLSFLHGNYVTLTNMTMDDIKRLARIKVSPINVSVQTTNPELRCKMLNNRFAGDIMEKMMYLAKHGISMNCQIVLCPGINDGDNLKNSLEDLAKLHPAVASVSVVPVGITKFREGLYPLEKYDRDGCRGVLGIVAEKQQEFLNKIGTRFIYAADEFYLGAGYEMPSPEEYEGFPQIENGVGMSASFKDEFLSALRVEEERPVSKSLSIACGTAVYPLMKQLADMCMQRFKGLNISVFAIENNFFGKTITVSGLLTAGDMIEQLNGNELGEKLLISRNTLKADEDVFLDDITLKEFSKAVGVPVVCVPDDGFELLDKILEN